MRSFVTSIFLYARESWTRTAEFQRRIQAMQRRCYRKLLHISYKDHVTNEEVRAKIQQAIGPHEDLLTIVKRRKLQLYGHVSHSSGLAKTILQGTVKGGKRQGRQRKRWEDNIGEWTGLELGKFQRAVEQGKMVKTGCKIIFGAPTTLAAEGLMMMMMMYTTVSCGAVCFFLFFLICWPSTMQKATTSVVSLLSKARLSSGW